MPSLMLTGSMLPKPKLLRPLDRRRLIVRPTLDRRVLRETVRLPKYRRCFLESLRLAMLFVHLECYFIKPFAYAILDILGTRIPTDLCKREADLTVGGGV